jgi:serine/threonine-protein kinase
MGEVWRATDTRLGRDVALKLLPAAFASDPDRLARFEREAKLLASLSHTHIAGLFALEEASFGDGATPVRFLAMELAEGEDLAERLKRGAIPVDEAIAIAKQIAEALEAAHEKGIVHRDLKPANVKVSAEGHVKVLDFGLAKAWSGEGDGATESADWSQSPTLARTGTAAGLILGTAAYMSPEQARGKPVDKRADVWSFGVLLFEMLTGRRLFDGETISDVLAAVLTREPQWNELPAAVPPSVRRLLRRCLERNPKNRQHDIADARIALDEVLSGVPEEATAAVAPRVMPLWRRALPWTVAACALVALALALVLWASWREAQPATSLRLSVELGADASLVTSGGPAAVLSPDGAVLAFVARKTASERTHLYVRRLDQLQAAPLSGTEGAANPFFSPDGRWVGFFADSKLKKIAITGGAAVALCDAPNSLGGSWAGDGSIFLTPSIGQQGLSRVSSAGGSLEPLTSLDTAAGETTHRWPQALFGGKAVLFTAHSTGDFEDANVVVQRLPDGPRKIVQRGGMHGRYLGSGHVVYVHEGTLFAVPFDLERLETTGEPAPVLEGVTSAPLNAGAQFAFSARGTLAYVRGQSLGLDVPIQWMARERKTQPLRAVPANCNNVRFSPDGRLLAMDIRKGGQLDVWVYEWARDTMSRLTSDPSEDSRPQWIPDGRRVAFASARGDGATPNLYWQRADGTGDAERLTESKNGQLPMSWHPTGRFLAYTETNPQTGFDIMILPLEGDEASGWKPGKPTVFLNSPFVENQAAFSPDGRWLAYNATETGRPEVYVRPFPGPGGKWQVSTGGGAFPTWSRNRKELFYRAADQTLMVAPYAAEGASFRAEKPRRWSPARIPLRVLGTRTFDLHPDGLRFAVLKAEEEQAEVKQDRLVFILNFFDELRRLAPAGKP